MLYCITFGTSGSTEGALVCHSGMAQLPVPPEPAMLHTPNPNPSRAAVPQTLTCRAAPGPCSHPCAADWQFLFIKGSIRTRMLVHEDPTAGACTCA